jgi:hypothetical protein
MCTSIGRLVEEQEEEVEGDSFGDSETGKGHFPVCRIYNGIADGDIEIDTRLEKGLEKCNSRGTLVDDVEVGDIGKRRHSKAPCPIP